MELHTGLIKLNLTSLMILINIFIFISYLKNTTGKRSRHSWMIDPMLSKTRLMERKP